MNTNECSPYRGIPYYTDVSIRRASSVRNSYLDNAKWMYFCVCQIKILYTHMMEIQCTTLNYNTETSLSIKHYVNLTS